MAQVTSHANYKYFVTFIDDYSRFTWIYFLYSKDEVFSVFKIFHAHIQTQFSAQIKILRSDNEVSICLICFRTSYSIMTSFLNDLSLQHLNKIGWLKERIVIFLMLFVLSC